MAKKLHEHQEKIDEAWMLYGRILGDIEELDWLLAELEEAGIDTSTPAQALSNAQAPLDYAYNHEPEPILPPHTDDIPEEDE